MVAKSMYLLNDFDAHSVNTILTLATPHSPVLYTDGILQSFYSSVNVFWAAYRDTKVVKNRLTILYQEIKSQNLFSFRMLRLSALVEGCGIHKFDQI